MPWKTQIYLRKGVNTGVILFESLRIETWWMNKELGLWNSALNLKLFDILISIKQEYLIWEAGLIKCSQ